MFFAPPASRLGAVFDQIVPPNVKKWRIADKKLGLHFEKACSCNKALTRHRNYELDRGRKDEGKAKSTGYD